MTTTSRRGALLCGLIASGRRARLTVFGSSMAPGIRSGEVVTLEKAAAADVGMGDVILVDCGGRLHLHRVVSTSPLRTRGDNSGDDAPVDRVLARVVTTAPNHAARILRRLRITVHGAWRACGSGKIES